MTKHLNNLADLAHTQARLNALLGAGSVFGEFGERVAARVTGSQRISGTVTILCVQRLPVGNARWLKVLSVPPAEQSDWRLKK